MEHDFSTKKVLVAPLNWGLGHATRCMPIIEALRAQKAEVYLASDGVALDLLRAEYPDLPTFELPSYNIRYFSRHFTWTLLLQMPKIIRACWLENRWLRRFVAEKNIDIVISDNRFGCFSAQTTNIFMTHQVNIVTPQKWAAPLVRWVNYYFIQKFDQCWIPDYAHAPNLSGSLSHGRLPQKVAIRYLGALSRLKKIAMPEKYAAIAVISGPEPQRSHFERKVRAAFETSIAEHRRHQMPPPQYCLVRGTTAPSSEVAEGYEVADFLTKTALNRRIAESACLICRSGYSTLMDLVVVEKPALLVPTPGQTEQEYLAETLVGQGLFVAQSQAAFNADSLKLPLAKGLKAQDFHPENYSLAEIVSELLK